MKKYIKIEYDFKKLEAKIVAQSHIESEFGRDIGKNYFIASNGVKLWSICYPDVSENFKTNIICVRGLSVHDNNKVLKFKTKKRLSEFIEAVNEYNEDVVFLYNQKNKKELDDIFSF